MTGLWAPETPGWGIENLAYGSFTPARGESPRLGVRIGDHILDLRPVAEQGELPPQVAAADLNPLLSARRPIWDEVRAAVTALLSDEGHRDRIEPNLIPLDTVEMRLPFAVADFVDFYSSEQHATNLGAMFRPDGEALLPNWKHLPVGYHGRAGTVVVSGTEIVRPCGQRRTPEGVTHGPSARLDIELEVGFVLGAPTEAGRPVSIAEADDHIFGFVLLNDWSARDIQAWEYQPLGPFLGKSFATSISPWVVPLAALDHARVEPPAQDPPTVAYLRTDQPWGLDIDLHVDLTTGEMRRGDEAPVRIASTNHRGLYWTPAQQLAHMTVNGATVRAGDLCGSGTISGLAPGSYGSLIELSWNGTKPIELPDGSARTFLEDGDEVVISGRSGAVDFGEVVGRIVPARVGG